MSALYSPSDSLSNAIKQPSGSDVRAMISDFTSTIKNQEHTSLTPAFWNSVSSTLAKCRSSDLLEAAVPLISLPTTWHSSIPHVQNEVVRILLANNKAKQALALVSSSNAFALNNRNLSRLLGACVREHGKENVEVGFALFQRALKQGTVPNMPVYHAMLLLSLKGSDQKRMDSILSHMDQAGVALDAMCHGLAIRMDCRHHNYEAALMRYNEMKQDKMRLKVTVLNELLEGVCVANQYSDAMMLFEDAVARMPSRGWNQKPLSAEEQKAMEDKKPLNEVSYNILMKMLGRQQRLDEVFKWYEDMKTKGITPSTNTINTLMHAVFHGKYRSIDSTKVYKVIATAGVVGAGTLYVSDLSEATSAIAITASVIASLGLGVYLNPFGVQKAIYPNDGTTKEPIPAAMLRRLDEEEHIGRLVYLWNELLGYGLKPDEATYDIFVRTCVRKRHPDIACQTLFDMKNLNSFAARFAQNKQDYQFELPLETTIRLLQSLVSQNLINQVDELIAFAYKTHGFDSIKNTTVNRTTRFRLIPFGAPKVTALVISRILRHWLPEHYPKDKLHSQIHDTLAFDVIQCHTVLDYLDTIDPEIRASFAFEEIQVAGNGNGYLYEVLDVSFVMVDIPCRIVFWAFLANKVDRYGKVRTDGIEYSSFDVPAGASDVTIRLVWSDLHGHVPPVVLIKFGALPTTTSYNWKFNGTSDTYYLSESIPDLHIGEYFVAVWGGATQSSIMDFGIGPSHNVWYHLKVEFTKCTHPNVIGNDCEYLAWPLAIFSTESIEMIQNQPQLSNQPFIAEGCFDQDEFYAIYTFTTLVDHFNAKFLVTVSRPSLAQSGLYWALYKNRANFIDSSTVPFYHGYGDVANKTSSLNLNTLPAGLWYLVIYYNAPDATSCSMFQGTSYKLSYELHQCTTDISSMNDCKVNQTTLDQIIINPMKNASAIDRSYLSSYPYIPVASSSLTYGIGYSLFVDRNMAGSRVIFNFIVPNTLDLTKVSIVLNCPSQKPITFIAFNATKINGLPFSIAFDLISNGNTLQDAINQTNLLTLTWPHFQPPSIGNWYITIQTTIQASWKHAFVAEMMACPPNMCGAFGTCLVKKSIQGMIYGDCLCAYGHAGAICNEVIAVQEIWHGWLLIFSNLAIAPPIAASLCRELYAEAIFFSALGIFSSAYHACDLNWYCALPFSFLMELDFALSYNSILLCLFYLSGVGHRSKIIAQAIGVIVLIILMLENPTSPGNMLIIIIIGGGQLLLAWSGMVHSLWHIFAMTAAGAFMNSRQTRFYRILDMNGANILHRNAEAKLPCAHGSSLIIPIDTPILDAPNEQM
ncbi:hypothetical protein THRCLA_06940 [Thraustotheca clavata]|uniref:EGF-like domain-containing protein n=1 Tax=Thraustotheca clavata TaxID=74557 RepID=A0A1V9ZHJ4_9STRA|nr:hypothetical protein THRCLA_06940 [Thraustotheca clavata]